MTDELKVRLATPADEEDIMALTRLVHEEIGHYTYNEAKVRAKVMKALNKQLALIGCIGEPGALHGCIYLDLEPVWYSDDWHLSELWNFVHPEHRRSDCASRMIKWAKSIADDMKMDLFIGVLNNVRTEAKARMYDRQLPRAGVFFLYHPQSPSLMAEAS